jgi:polyisoprenoid-binding protein YceI
MKQNSLALILGSLAIPPMAQALEFNHIQTDNSTIAFVYKQMGVPIEGVLKKFDAQFNFDPAKLPTAKAVFAMHLTSIDAGTQEANDEIAQKVWFDTQDFPQAKFVSSTIQALGDNRYQVTGQLSIKGRTKDVSGNFSYSGQHNIAVFDGTFTLNRADFAIGEGAWANFGIVANEILIKFHLLADAGK